MHATLGCTRRRGYTIVEVAIALLVFSLILGASAMVSTRGTDAARSAELQTDVLVRARRAVDRMAMELTNAGSGQLNPDPGSLGTSAFAFRRSTGIDGGGNPTWSELWRLDLQADPGDPDDGIDNDTDGVIDERLLVMTRDSGGPQQLATILCRDVTELTGGELPNGADDNGNGLVDEPGFVITRLEDLLTIRLTVEKHARDGLEAQSAVQTCLTLRN